MKHIRYIRITRRTVAVIGIVLLLSISGALLYFSSFSSKTLSLQKYADHVIKECASSESSLRCYDKMIPQIMDEGASMEDAFAVIRLVQAKDTRYRFCHVAGHKISTNQYMRDPSDWKEVLTKCPTGICSNGCLHGALQARFNSDSLSPTEIRDVLPELNDVCEPRASWKPTPKEQSSCYHEIGHLSMYVTNANIPAAFDICRKTGVKSDGRNYLQTCSEGIFMQVFEPREVDDFALIYRLVPDKDKLSECSVYSDPLQKGGCWKNGWKAGYKTFCNQFEPQLRESCFREAWVIQDKELESASGLAAYCTYSTDPTEKARCFNKLIFGLMASFDFDQERMKNLCKELPRDLQGPCFAHVASRLIETDKELIADSLAMCKFADKYGVAETCYDELTYYANFLYAQDSSEQKKLCAGMPEKWREVCLAGGR